MKKELIKELIERVVELRDITRVVHSNRYGPGGFQHEAFIRSIRADNTLVLVEALDG